MSIEIDYSKNSTETGLTLSKGIKKSDNKLEDQGNPVNQRFIKIDSRKKSLKLYAAQVFNIMNTTLGSGVLSLPFTCKMGGLVNIAILLFFYFLMASYSFYIYSFIASKVYRISKNLTEEEKKNINLKRVWVHLYPSLKYAVDIIIIVNCFFACVGYLVAMGGLAPTEIAKFILSKEAIKNMDLKKQKSLSKIVVILVASIFQFLLSLLKSLDSLKYVSYLGFFSNFYLIALSAVTFRKNFVDSKVTSFNEYAKFKNILFSKFSKAFFEAASILVVCYNCHYASIPIFRSLLESKQTEKTKLKKLELVKQKRSSVSVSEDMKESNFPSGVAKADLGSLQTNGGKDVSVAMSDGTQGEREKGIRRNTLTEQIRGQKEWNYELKKLAKGFGFVSLFSYLGVFVINLGTMLSGYLAFGSDIKGNIAENFSNDLWGGLLKLAVLVSVFCCYPLVFRSFRESFYNMLAVLNLELGDVARKVGDGLSILLIFLLGTLINDLSFVNSMRGALVGSAILYMIPGLMLIRCKKRVKRLVYYSGFFLFVFGFLSMVLGLVFLFST